jgi:hypothetical protein
MEGNKKLEDSKTYYSLQTNLINICKPWKTSTNFIEIKLSIVSTIKVLSTFLKLVACDWLSNGYGLCWIMISMSLKLFAKFEMNACTWL